MLKEYKQIDAEGFVLESFVYDAETEVIPEDCKAIWPEDVRLFRPRYNRTLALWEEGVSQEELDAENEKIKKGKTEIFSKICRENILSGFDCEINGIVHTFRYDQETQLNFQDTYSLFENNMISSIFWTAYIDNEKKRIPLQKELFKTVYLSGIKHKNNHLSYLNETLLPLLETSTSIETTRAIEWDETAVSELFVLDENNTIEKKLNSVETIKTEIESQKSYNVYMESTVLELADMMMMSMI